MELVDRDARAQTLAERRRRLALTFVDDALDEPTYREQLAAIARELAKLDLAERILDVPRLDWSWPPANVNAVLRALWSEIRLDEQMRPVQAVWRVPQWRAPDDASGSDGQP